MFRYVTLTDKNTIDKVSDTKFDGSVQVWVANNDLSTFLNTPWLCWVEQNPDGSYLLHVPADAPRPAYEEQIEGFKTQLANLEANDAALKEQLESANQINKALVSQIQSVQNQNIQMSAQISALTASNQPKQAETSAENTNTGTTQTK